MSATVTVQILSITTALVTSGGIATLSLFDAPLLISQHASRSLPLTRWLFSRGSHIFPTAAFISSSGFAYLAYTALPTSTPLSASTLLQHAFSGTSGLYLAAAALTLSIGPFTQLMIPTNFRLIALNEAKGGARSAESAAHRKAKGASVRSAEESTEGKDDVSQWMDQSGPQERTEQDTTAEEDREVRRLLEKFRDLNAVRAVLIGAGGVVGLIGALLRE
jgi:hypothetical protein